MMSWRIQGSDVRDQVPRRFRWRRIERREALSPIRVGVCAAQCGFAACGLRQLAQWSVDKAPIGARSAAASGAGASDS